MRKLIAISASVLCATLATSDAAQAQLRSDINFSSIANTVKNTASNFSFNYFVKYLGPSLSNDYQEGATYNRFKTGQSIYSGDDLDHTASYQTFQAFKLGYKLPNGMILAYGLSYQDDVKENIEYEFGERDYGRSFNNDRVSLWIPNIVNNNLFYIGASVYYEIPTTEGSKEADMQYGLGFQPSLGFYSPIPGLSYGIGASLERDVYADNEREKVSYKMPDWCSQPGYTCDGVTPYRNVEMYKRQAFRASVSPYLNYSLTDSLTLKSALTFDWDQVGDQESTTKFNANLDDIYSLGLSYLLTPNVNIAAGLEGSVNKPHIERTALFGSLGVSI